MLVHMVEGRNEAWHREDVARARVHELEFYVEDLRLRRILYQSA